MAGREITGDWPARDSDSTALAFTPSQHDEPFWPLQDLKDEDVMQRLHLNDHKLVAAASRELRRRGYRAFHVELSKRLTDPDPAVRKRLAESLPEIPGINSLAWLRRLARDEDAEVRITALTILATSSDPEIKKWVREAIRNEADHRVSQRLQHVLLAR